MLKLYSAGFISLGSLLAGCGNLTGGSYENQIDASLVRSSQQVLLELQTDGLGDGDATNAQFHRFATNVDISGQAGKNENELRAKDLEIQVTVTNPKNEVIFDGKQPGPNAEWEIALNHGEGVYSISARLIKPVGYSFQVPAPVSRVVHVDFTPPKFHVALSPSVDPQSGEKKFDLAVSFKDNELPVCEPAALRTANAKDVNRIPLAVEEADGAMNLSAKGVVLPESTDGSLFMVAVKCMDGAGNSAEIVQPVREKQSELSQLVASLGGPKGIPFGENLTEPHVFLRPGSIEAQLELLHRDGSGAVNAKIAQSEQGFLRVYFTDELPTSMESLLAKTALWSQPFASTIKFPFPPGAVGARTLFATMTRRLVETGEEVIVNTVPLQIYVDLDAPRLKWASGAQYVPAGLNAPVTLETQLTLTGAPLTTERLVEYSTDGTTWNPLAHTDWAEVAGVPNTYRFKIAYPFAEEKPFRVRLKVKDLAGNETISSMSPNLMGRSGLDLAVPAAERAGCKAPGAEVGSRLAVHLVSRVMCRKLDANGNLSGNYRATLGLQNRGSEVVKFLPIAQKEYMPYVVTGATTQLFRLDSPTVFKVAPTGLGFANFEVTDANRAANLVSIEFDKEETGVHTTANACYGNTEYPQVVLQDKANGVALVEGPFPCDALPDL